jgi:pimeloyl-ACP methyl ester carboxylesterase
MNIFSLGMDELASEIQRAGIPAIVDSYADGDALVTKLTAQYRAGDHGPIILIGHSLGADAVMQMAQMLNRNNVPVALVVPFDGTQSFRAPKNVARVLNLTQREYAYMRPGAGFHGMLKNVDVSGDPNIGHITIDKSPRLHRLVLSYVRSVVGSSAPRHTPSSVSAAKHTSPTESTAPAAKQPAPQSAKPQSAKPTLRGRLDEKTSPAG